MHRITVNGGFPDGVIGLPETSGDRPMFPLHRSTNDESAWLGATASALLCTLRNPCR
jgi:hypothetical protein